MTDIQELINQRKNNINNELKHLSERIKTLEIIQRYSLNKDFSGLINSQVDINIFGEDVKSEIDILIYLSDLGLTNTPQYEMALNKVLSSPIFKQIDENILKLNDKKSALTREAQKWNTNSWDILDIIKMLESTNIPSEQILTILKDYVYSNLVRLNKEGTIEISQEDLNDNVKNAISEVNEKNKILYEEAKKLISDNYYLFSGKDAQSISYLESLCNTSKEEQASLMNTSYPRQYLAFLIFKLIKGKKDIDDINNKNVNDTLMTNDDKELLEICYEELKDNINLINSLLSHEKEESIISSKPVSNISYLFTEKEVLALSDSDREDVKDIIDRLKGIDKDDGIKNIRHIGRRIKYDGNKLMPYVIFNNNMGVAYVTLDNNNILVVCMNQKKTFYEVASRVLTSKEIYIKDLILESKDYKEEFNEEFRNNTILVESALNGRREEDEPEFRKSI